MINFDLFGKFGSEKLPSDSSDLLLASRLRSSFNRMSDFSFARSKLIQFLGGTQLSRINFNDLVGVLRTKNFWGQFEPLLSTNL